MYSEPMTHLPDPERQGEFYASVPVKRGLAWVVDTILIALITTVLALISIVGVFFWLAIFVGVSFVYRWVTIALGSATPGMRLMAIEFRDAYGRRLNSLQAFLHTVGYFVSWGFGVVQLASIIFMMTTERGQGLTDMVLGTTALNRRA